MGKKWLLLAGAADLFILSLLDKVAFKYYFYWRYGWFDILMHTIGGLAIGLVSTYTYLERRPETMIEGEKISSLDFNWKSLLLFNLVFALVIGGVWEVFELTADRIVVFNWLDSGFDTVFGIIGSLLAGLISGILAIWIHNWRTKKLN